MLMWSFKIIIIIIPGVFLEEIKSDVVILQPQVLLAYLLCLANVHYTSNYASSSEISE